MILPAISMQSTRKKREDVENPINFGACIMFTVNTSLFRLINALFESSSDVNRVIDFSALCVSSVTFEK